MGTIFSSVPKIPAWKPQNVIDFSHKKVPVQLGETTPLVKPSTRSEGSRKPSTYSSTMDSEKKNGL